MQNITTHTTAIPASKPVDDFEFYQKVDRFVTIFQRDALNSLIERKLCCEANRKNNEVRVGKESRKFWYIDVGHAGRYMVEVATQKIFGVKAYGQVHYGKQYGTLDTVEEFNWGPYYAVRKPKAIVEAEAAAPRDSYVIMAELATKLSSDALPTFDSEAM